MTAKDVLKTQYRFFYMTAKANLEGITAEESMVQPSPAGNCANWIVGHMIGAHNAVMQLVDEDPVWEDEAVGPGKPEEPITSADEALDWNTMVTRLTESEPRFMAGLARLDDDALDHEGFTDPFGDETTRGGLLNLLAVHQHYHAGQLGLSRRLVGRPGAIRSPSAR